MSDSVNFSVTVPMAASPDLIGKWVEWDAWGVSIHKRTYGRVMTITADRVYIQMHVLDKQGHDIALGIVYFEAHEVASRLRVVSDESLPKEIAERER